MYSYAIYLTLPILCVYLLKIDAQSSGSLPLTVKDSGVVELKKGDVAMIFYITVTNTGNQPLHLLVNGTRCCQKVTKDDEDCESMKLIGGDMGNLFPQDSRNLTLLYINLYLHNRVGTCDVEIKGEKGGKMTHSINFNTTLVKGQKVHIPRLLEQLYEPEDVMPCNSVDKDPLNRCQPYECDIRYDGLRSIYNFTTNRCEKIPKCVAEPTRPNQLVWQDFREYLATNVSFYGNTGTVDVHTVLIGKSVLTFIVKLSWINLDFCKKRVVSAYDVETGTCKNLIMTMTEYDFAGFKEGKPSIHSLSHEHGYPINVRCHNGKVDSKGHWCECEEGWASAPFDHKFFNPDIQVYHMCTVWTGVPDMVMFGDCWGYNSTPSPATQAFPIQSYKGEVKCADVKSYTRLKPRDAADMVSSLKK